jgi:hypothetical protein
MDLYTETCIVTSETEPPVQMQPNGGMVQLKGGHAGAPGSELERIKLVISVISPV